MTSLSIAQELISLGFELIPIHTVDINGNCSCNNETCKHQGKHPRTPNGVYDASNCPEQIKEWFNCDWNIGIATGEEAGIWVLDLDDLDSEHHQHLNGIETVEVETGSGNKHYYFKFNSKCKGLKNAVKFDGDLDCRTDGAYAIAPGSKHKSGGSYKWIRSPKDHELKPAPDWLIELIPKHDDKPVKVIEQIESSTITNEEDNQELINRAIKYLEKCDPAIAGENGHGQCYKIIANLVEKFGDLEEEDLLGVLNDWNNRCEPPWSDKELLHKIDSARRNTTNDKRVAVSSSAGGTRREPGNVIETEEEDSLSVNGDAYQGIIGEIVKAIEPETEADPMAILISLLTALGSAIGKTPYFAVGGGRHHCNLIKQQLFCKLFGVSISCGLVLEDEVSHLSGFPIVAEFYENGSDQAKQ